MSWIWWLAVVLAGAAAAALLAWGLVHLLSRREPYGAVMRLPLRAKIAFFRLLIADSRIPWPVRVIPVLALIYLISPIDLLPGIFLDDVAVIMLMLVALLRLIPRAVVLSIIQEARNGRQTPPTGDD